MTLDIRNIESAFLRARAAFEEWKAKADHQMNGVVMEDQFRKQVNLLPEEMVKDVRGNLSPSAKETLDKLIGKED